MFQTKVVQKIKTHILCSVAFFRKSCHLWDNVGKYCSAGQATDDDIAHAHCVVDTKGHKGYKHTLRICNTFCFSHYNNGCTNVSQWYLTRTLHVLLTLNNIWLSLLFYNFTGIVAETIGFLTGQGCRHIVITFVFLFLPLWRRPHEWPKHVGGHYVIKLYY